jgi:predicted O-methyltransferase YrrM
MKQLIKKVINKLPYIRSLVAELENTKGELELLKVQQPIHPIGHFYSPIVSKEEVEYYANKLFSNHKDEIEGISLNKLQQVELLEQLTSYYSELPFKDVISKGLRYYYKNDYYCHSDAIFLYSMIRHFKPKSIIEVGSGFSSAVMLDTNDIFFNGSINLSFIEPYPDRLLSLFNDEDKNKTKVIAHKVQDVDLDIFDTLQENDILFIDSTHVSKTGSDVNKILFEILPRLKPGVIIHFHDIFYPFEYPKEWVLGWNGFGWNEAYLLKAFLMYNHQYSILLSNTYLSEFNRTWFQTNMPLCLENEGGSIWIRKI